MPHDFPEFSYLETLRALAGAHAPVLLDIRLPQDVSEDPSRLPGLSHMSQLGEALELALHNGPPSACFPMLDHIYRGAVRRALSGREHTA